MLEPGDTLLLESDPAFADRQRNSRDFFLVSRLENSSPPHHEKAIIAIVILLGLVLALAANVSTVVAALGAAAAMLLTRCTTIGAARRSVDWETLLAIAASFAFGSALEVTGAAAGIAGSVMSLAGGDRWVTLAITYAITLIVTELITNNAAAVLMFPLAISTAEMLGSLPRAAIDDNVIDRALEVQGMLARSSQHRGVSLPDLLLAAAAERAGLVVLHYDSDFDRLGDVTGQPIEWVVSRGSVS